eukprot:274469-Amphidinium_carterae.1
MQAIWALSGEDGRLPQDGLGLFLLKEGLKPWDSKECCFSDWCTLNIADVKTNVKTKLWTFTPSRFWRVACSCCLHVLT